MDWIKLKAGDTAAWDESTQELVTFAKNFVRWRFPGLPSDDLQEVADQAVILLIEKIDKIDEIDSEEGLFRWLFRCAKRRAIDRLRKTGRKKNILREAESLDFEREEGYERADETSPIPDQEAIHAERCSLAAVALERLEPDDAQLFREIYHLKLPHREIAANRGWDTSSVGNRINQALNRARKLLSSDPRFSEICSSGT